MANILAMASDSALASETWEFHTRAYLLVMLADFYSIVDAVATTLAARNLALTPRQLRKVCERAAIKAFMSARKSDLRTDLYQFSDSAGIEPASSRLKAVTAPSARSFHTSEMDDLVSRRLTNVEQDKAFIAGGSIANGNYSRDNLNVIVEWKMEGVYLTRVMSYLGQNTDADIHHATIEAGTERSALEIHLDGRVFKKEQSFIAAMILRTAHC